MENNQVLVIILGFLLALVAVAAVYIAIQWLRAPSREQQTGVVPQLAEPTAPVLPSLIPQLTDEIRVAKGLSRTKVFFQQTFDKLFAGAKGEEFFGEMEEVLLT